MAAPRGNPIPLSYEERLKIYELLQKGLTYRTIADEIGRYIDTVRVELIRGGGSLSYCPHKSQKAYENKKLAALKRRFRIYSKEEKELLEISISEGFSKNKISILSGVSYYRTVHYLKKYHPEYEPTPDQLKIERRSLEERISSIEMQLEIIIDRIKEI